MALTENQKIDIRRHLGYGPFGNTGTAGSFAGYRFFQHYGLLEFRLQNLQTKEEQVLVGNGDDNNPISPNFVDPASDKVYQGYLNICNFLEGQVGTVTDNLDIDQAGSYKARKDEMPARINLYRWWCKQMADFLALPLNPAKFNKQSGMSRPLVN